jgi:phosphonate degradation associated HDIG domain protein
MLDLDDIARRFQERGHEQYTGEPVTQLEHALQTALLAEQNGANDALVTAALLHDFGHLLHDPGQLLKARVSAASLARDASPTMHGIDDLHQYIALPFLRGLFGEDVLNPIQWHVDAKRYLCATRPDYFDSLSADSVRSLKLQGGVFTPAQAEHFVAQPGAADAVALRIWDDLAKTQGLPTPPLSHFLKRAERCVLTSTR